MINIKKIFLLNVIAYVACSGGDKSEKEVWNTKTKPSTTLKYWSDNESSEPSSTSDDSDGESFLRPKCSKEKSPATTKSTKQKPINANIPEYGVGGSDPKGKNVPTQAMGSQGANFNFMEGGLTINGKRIPGNLIENQNINIDTAADGLKINGKKVPGVNPFDAIAIDWNEQGGITVNGEKKTGFGDIKWSGRTLLGQKSNPVDSSKYYSKGKSPATSKSTNANIPEYGVGGSDSKGKNIPRQAVGIQGANFDLTGAGSSHGSTADKKSQKNKGVSSEEKGYVGGYTFTQDDFDDPTVPVSGNWVISGSNIGNVNCGKRNEDNVDSDNCKQQ